MSLAPVRLCDVAFHVRLAAARRLARQDPSVAVDVFLAAVEPSDLSYWVSEEAARGMEWLRPTSPPWGREGGPDNPTGSSGPPGSIPGARRTGVLRTRATLPTDPESL